MITAAELAKRIVPGIGEMTTFHLQKLLYYCQAWSLGRTGIPVFADAIVAYPNGPVVASVFEMHRGLRWVRSSSFEQIPSAEPLPADVDQSVVDTLAFYAGLSADQLVQLTHAESPWMDAYAQGEKTVITHDAMRTFYANKTYEQAIHDCFVSAAAQIATEEAELLAMLAR